MLIGFGFGMYVGECIYSPGPINFKSPKMPEKEIKKENNLIDSLKKKEVIVKDSIIFKKGEVILLEKEKIIEKNKIDKLPLDSNINFLKIKLREYEQSN